ncbi:LSU m3Psi1915 methyltransferase RlmH/ybeA [Thioalkalivibrio nitratireducens DSM 14787]|uniref:Ribosomal RNA large subunit methyltransferase H n=1 Tax=Thioalkalivibrio nitratireducens (strain DSM 14787 / UNIQEM 213 / ALEN2) TaxID=1255043 RepID=L0E0J4_THIND|nr:23S rRNA (pseudouridine(1915)-N(3))-methyltransferase RlmH [Thioalkalivibrio nitratireducens]AGA34161.1 LSU m3Psi1915 methyltransferase RlmH/ybeA [Thioalkalivibrio nitratireducens DSM 14787]
MRLHLIAIGQRMPGWVAEGFAEYAGRMPRDTPLQLQALAGPARSRAMDASTLRRAEAQALLAAVPPQAILVALDERGDRVDTRRLAARFEQWRHSGRDVALLIGGAAGLDASIRERADWIWSLSALTFPHMLVRVLVAEQLYRAWSVLANHPYHRA